MLLAAFPFAEAEAQTGEDALLFTERFPATGPRLMGMGGASVAGVADYGALFTNPAGLGYFEHSQAAGSLNGIFVQTEGEYRVSGSSPRQSSISNVVPANANLVYKFPTVQGSFVVAGGFNQRGTYTNRLEFDGTHQLNTITATFLPFDYGVDGNRPTFFRDLSFVAYEAGAIEFFPSDYEDGEYPFEQAVLLGTEVFQEGDLIEEGNLREFNLGGAAEVSPGIMVGLSGNIIFGEYSREYFFEEVLEGTEPAPYVVFREGTRYEGFDRFSMLDGSTSELTGVNLRGGFSAQLGPVFRVGGAIETSSQYQVENRFNIRMETHFQDGQMLSFRERSGEFERSNFTYEFTTPWRFSLGGAVDTRNFDGIAADFRLGADIEFADWSSLRLSSGENDDFYSDENRFIRDNYGSEINLKVGGEVDINQATFRGGYAYMMNPRRDEMAADGQRDASFFDKQHLTAGVGYQVNPQVQLNAGWVFSSEDDSFFAYTDPEEGLSSRPVTENRTRHQFFLGAAYSF